MGKFQDLTGQRFGNMTVISRAEDYRYDKQIKVQWLCKCDCGNEKVVRANDLKNGRIVSCGCYRDKKSNERVYKDLTGENFGELHVIKDVGRNKYGRVLWECSCSCGRTITTPSNGLLKGSTTSCGHTRATMSDGLDINDGHSKERLYQVWVSMKDRCYNPNNKTYKDYGGRGITICDEWRFAYKSFRDWAMLTGYDPDAPRGQCTIDRIDVNGNYCPENCRWATMAEQAKNTRRQLKTS